MLLLGLYMKLRSYVEQIQINRRKKGLFLIAAQNKVGLREM